MKKTSKTWVIFDFDGTITHSESIAYEVFSILQKKYKINTLTEEELIDLKTVSFKKKMKTLGLPFWKIPKVVKDMRKLTKTFLVRLEPLPYIKRLCLDLKAKGFHLAIVSSNQKTSIESFLNAHDFKMFDVILGNAKIFKKQKTIKQLFKIQQVNITDAVYIGDETRDIIACHKIGLDVIAVTWGYESKEQLEKYHPTYMVDHVAEIQSILL